MTAIQCLYKIVVNVGQFHCHSCFFNLKNVEKRFFFKTWKNIKNDKNKKEENVFIYIHGKNWTVCKSWLCLMTHVNDDTERTIQKGVTHTVGCGP